MSFEIELIIGLCDEKELLCDSNCDKNLLLSVLLLLISVLLENKFLIFINIEIIVPDKKDFFSFDNVLLRSDNSSIRLSTAFP